MAIYRLTCRIPIKQPVLLLLLALLSVRRVIILVQAGAPVDSTIDHLCESMEPGDIIIDGGNEW